MRNKAEPFINCGEYLPVMVILWLFVPLMILLHELAHYTMSCALGYQSAFCYDRIVPLPNQGLSKEDFVAITVVGPMVEMVLGGIGIWGLLRNSNPSLPMMSIRRWMLTALALAGLRWFKVIFDGSGSDEASLSQVMGLHHLLLPALLIPLSLAATTVIIRFHWRHQTLRPLLAGMAAAGLSTLVWISLLGPALLPHPELQGMKVKAAGGQQGALR